METEDITRINTELQKRPDDSYLEFIGHYVIDRLTAGAGPLQTNNTLKGCMKAISEAAREKTRDNVVVLSGMEIYKIIDRYFGFPADFAAQQESAKTVCMGAGIGWDAGAGALITPTNSKPIAHARRGAMISLDDFL